MELPFALVTGASEGLGRALAGALARRGIGLVLSALPGGGLAQTADALARRHGVRVEWQELDLCGEEGARTLFEWTRERGLAVGMLVNNAGVSFHGPFAESRLEQNERMIRLNVLAPVRLTHLFLPELRRHSPAYLLQVASLAAFYPLPCKSVYAPSKSFLLHFSLALREELRGTGVRVSVLCPGGMRTNAACRELIDGQGAVGRLSAVAPDRVAEAAVRGLLAGRPVIVPGLLNKLLRLAGTRAPRTVVARAMAGRFRGAGAGAR